jgi:succinate dehydrogenase / fumarate reductase iron-sulfur subunit
MGQIMRLRRIATQDHHIVDVNNGERHEEAFTTLVKDNGLLWEAELLPRSYGGNSRFGKFAPSAGKELLSSLPSILKGLARRKVTPAAALKPHKIPREDLKAVQGIYDRVEGREQRYELNLYVVGADEDGAPAAAGSQRASSASSPPGAEQTPESAVTAEQTPESAVTAEQTPESAAASDQGAEGERADSGGGAQAVDGAGTDSEEGGEQ